MGFVHVNISIRGITEAEARSGLPNLLDEFRHRHWLLNPSAVWDTTLARLTVAIDYKGDDPKLCGQAVLDEVRDCLVATVQTESDIHFEINDSRLVPAV